MEIDDRGEPLILALDTTSACRSLALARGGALIGELGIESLGTHAQMVHTEMGWLIERLGRRFEDIDLVACCIGPGSFTGLRVSVATAKGLADALRVPLAPVSSLAALAHRSGARGVVGTMSDALRGDVYIQRFEVTGDERVTGLDDPSLCPAKVGWLQLRHSCDWVVKSVPSDPSEWTQEAEGRERLIELRDPFLAASVARLAWGFYQEGKLSESEAVDGLYVRAPDAEVHRARKQDR